MCNDNAQEEPPREKGMVWATSHLSVGQEETNIYTGNTKFIKTNSKCTRQVCVPAVWFKRVCSQDRNYGKTDQISTSRLRPLKREVADGSGRSVEGGSGHTHVLVGHPAGR